MMSKSFNKLSTRSIVAVIGIPLIVALCLLGKIYFLMLPLGIGLISFYELAKMARNKHSYVNLILGSLIVFLIIVNEYRPFIEIKLIILFSIIVLLLSELFRNKESAISNLGTTLLGIFYIGFFSGSLVDLREFYNDSAFTYFQGGYLIISILVSIWVCDSAAYFLGTALGKHKLMPRISPNKSWEGAIAGFIFSVITFIAAKALVLEFLEWRDIIVIGIIIGILGQFGDLIESMIKRDSRVKDSSSIIPGHGGILDRFDSLLFTAPAVYLYLKLMQ
jgi:phosphatidate cytidylyltransferase